MQLVLGFVSILASGTVLGFRQAPGLNPPNVIIIFMDDMGYGDPVFVNGFGYSTPNMDKLAAAGMRFTNFYAAQATCTASRAGILTGCYPNRINMYGAFFPWDTDALDPKEETIAKMLKKRNYQTCMVGKWGLGSLPPFTPLHYGFDHYLGLLYSNDMWPVDYAGNPIEDTANWKYRYPPLPLYRGDSVIEYVRTLKDQGELTQKYTRYAVNFIKKNKDRPFFLYLAHTMVHVPIMASSKFLGKSGVGLFGDVIEEVDWSIGQIMKTIKEAGLDKNTLIVFTSDNGPWLNYGNHAGNTGGLREGKGTSFEGGQREACVFRWPGHISAGTVSNKIASSIDLLPTISKICGTPLPDEKIDGVDILPLLLNKTGADPRTEFAYYYNKNDLEAIRNGKWKLVFPHTSRSYKVYPPGNNGFPGRTAQVKEPMALYNLSVDPGETMDVQESNPDIVQQLNELADKYRKDLGDNLQNIKGNGRRPSAVCDKCKTNFRKPISGTGADIQQK